MRRHPAGLLLVVGLAVLPSPGVSAAERGTLSGVVRLDGPAPARPPLPVFKHAEICGASVPDDRLVVGPGGGLRYAVVTIEGIRGGNRPDRDVEHVLDNTHCRFEPHVQVAEVGHWLEITNSDPILHNVRSLAVDNPTFNFGQPTADPGRKLPAMQVAERFTIKCDIHPWMAAHVSVFEHPYFTVSGADGSFAIPGTLPDGQYTVTAWHEKLGEKQASVVVGDGKPATAEFVFDPSNLREE